jgi:hypothetical protein
MSIKHVSEESATIAPASKFLRGSGLSKLETKVGASIENGPTITSATNIGTTAYITATYTQASTGGVPTSYTCTSSPGGLTATQETLSKPFIITGLTSNTAYTFTVSAVNGSGPKDGAASSTVTTTISSFSSGSNQTVADLHTLCTTMANGTTTATPTAGGSLTVNSASLGSYDYTIKRGNQTVTSTFTTSDWFTSTEDTRSAFIVVDGNLTINRKALFRPSVRKLFTCIYVTGNLQVDGDISMRNRGANHSATAAAAIRLHTGTFSGVSNPQVPAAGGAGGASASRTGTGETTVNAGTAGTAGGTGGGGSGRGINAADPGSTVASGGGAAGTSFSGGSGGGSMMVYSGSGSAGAGVANGGRGGAAGYSGTYASTGGAGNPIGITNNGGTAGSYPYELNYWAADGPSRGGGTGGVLVIFVKGTLNGQTGSIGANGCQGATYRYPYYMQCSGAGSGGGSVTVFYGYDSSLITPTANGGPSNGGNGGAGTARKLSLI